MIANFYEETKNNPITTQIGTIGLCFSSNCTVANFSSMEVAINNQFTE